MSSVNKLTVQQMLAKGDVMQVNSDEPIAFRLKYTGTGSVTSVVVTTGTKIVLTTSEDSGLTFTFSDYATIGALVDAINATSYWEVKTLDALRSDATATQFVDGSVSVNSDVSEKNIYDVNVDTSAALYFAARLTFDRGFLKEEVRKSHRVELNELVYNLTLGDAASLNADALKVYEVDQKGNEILKMSGQPTSGSVTTENFAGGEIALTASNGNDIVVRIDDGTSIVDSNDNFLRLVGVKE